MKKTRILALLLCLCLLAGLLSGCNKDKADPSDPSKPSSGSTTQKPDGGKTDSAAAQTSAKYVYKTSYIDLDLGCEYLNQTCVSGKYFFAIGEVMTDPGSGTPDYGIMTDLPAVEELVEAEDEAQEPTEDAPTEEPEPYVPPTYETRIYRVDLTTGQWESMDFYTKLTPPEGAEGDGWINMFLPGADGSLWIYDTMETYSYDLPEDFDPETQYEWDYYVPGEVVRRLQQFSADGELLNTVNLDAQAIVGQDAYLEVALVDEKNQIYAYDWSTGVYVLDATGKVIKNFPLDEGEMGGASLINFCGKPALETWGESSSIQVIDPETLELGEPITPPYNGYQFMTSYDQAYDYYYQINQNIYGYKIAEQVSEKVVDWMDCDVDLNDLGSIYPLEDGRIIALMNEWDQEDNTTTFSLVVLEQTDAATVAPKTVFTLACMYLDWDLRNRILEFNRGSEDYRILVEDYSQYNTQEDYTAGLTKLNTEILSGKIPDLLYSGGDLPLAQYAGKGLLVDLLPLIDSDPELSREDLMANVIEAASMDGKLYQAFSEFSIESNIALEKVVGDYDQWTLTELKDAMTKLQPGASTFGVGYIRESVLSGCVSRNLASFIDWSTGECSFDSQEFRELLEFANTFPEEFDWQQYEENGGQYLADHENLMNGNQLLASFYLYSFVDSLWTLAPYQDAAIRFIGYPSTQGNGSTFSLSGSLSITATCPDQAGAWQFVRQVFTEEYQSERMYYGLPTNANVFDRQLEEAMTVTYMTDADGNFILDENGEKIVEPKASYWVDENTTIDIDCMSQEQAQQLMDLYESIHSVKTYDEDVYEIVQEEAAGYFAGQTPLDEAVKRIQNRVNLYVKEKG